MEIGDRHFGGRDEEQIVPRHRVEVFLELGKLAGAGERGAVHQERRRHLQVAVLAGVQIEHEVRERAHQPRARSDEDRKAGAADLGAPGQIKQAEGFADLPVRPGRKWQCRAVAPAANNLVR